MELQARGDASRWREKHQWKEIAEMHRLRIGRVGLVDAWRVSTFVERGAEARSEMKTSELQSNERSEVASGDLLACRQCGSQARLTTTLDDRAYAECNNDDCMHAGPVARTWTGAARLWNRQQRQANR